MGAEQPFIYDRPNSWNFAGPTDRSFNPKAATQASWTPKPSTPKKDGPLIDFNKHPDSYLVVPYGNLTTEPMHPNTRFRVKRGRQTQLFLRVCALLSAMGLLFCCIAITRTSSVVAWIIRVAPALALIHTTYGVYHLCKAAEGRTPTSTASYMLFAAMVDTGLLPFFAFSAYLSYFDWHQNLYGWSTLFGVSETSYKIILTFFCLCSAEAGLLFCSLIMDIFLAIMFRRISKMPPDMNPLEPNLTSRHGQKHKRNKSSMNVTEKHMSTSTLANARDSGISGRRVPYLHTRTDSADSVTLYGNESARNSRIEMRKGFEENKMDPYMSKNSSRVTLAPTRPTSAINPAENARSVGAGLDHRPARSSGLAHSSPQRSPNRSPERPSSWLSYLDYEGVPTDLSEEANQNLNQEVRPISPISALSSRGPSIDQARQQTERENWYGGSARGSQAELPPTNRSTLDLGGRLAPPDFHQMQKRSREPLGMNPPTPPVTHQHYQDENVYTPAETYGALDPGREVLTPTNANIQHPSRPSSFIGSGGKSRFYGTLRASMGSAGDQQTNKPTDSNIVDIYDDDMYGESYDRTRTRTMESTNSASDYSGNFEVYASDSDEEGTVSQLNVQHLRIQPKQDAFSPAQRMSVTVQTASPVTTGSPNWNGARTVSNSTGHDLHSGYAGLGSEFGRGMARRREVSGKVAEEGRSDVYEIEEEDTPKKKGMGASAGGWARFKGL